MIPKIIHHTAPKDTNKWHPIWDICHQSWKKNFLSTEFKHILWNDEDINNLIKNKFPRYWYFYNQLPYHIMQIDFAKICILFEYGGIYADMDFYCYDNFYNELTEDTYIVGSKASGEIVQNSLMCSSKQNIFYLNFLRFCIQRYHFKKCDSHELPDYIKNSTGPGILSNFIVRIPDYNKFILDPNIYNNHPLFYSKEIKTRHMLTGIWGRETINDHLCSSKSIDIVDYLQKHNFNHNEKTNIKSLNDFDFAVNYL